MRTVRRRSVVVGALAAAVVLGLVGVSAAALTGHFSSRVAAAHVPSTTWAPTPTTTVVVTTTVPPSTTSTTSSVPTTNTVPPTTQAPTTIVPKVAAMQISPSTADFPSTPPPYWPMPIVHVTVTNSGATTIDSVVVHPIGVYSVPSTTCTTLAPGQSCGADVQFCPTSPGNYVDTLTVTAQNAATASPLQAAITVEGTAT